MGSISNVHTGYFFIFQNSSCCWKGFLLPYSSTHLCKTPSPTQLFSSICNASPGKLLKSYGSGLPTPHCSWMWCSGHPLHLNIDSSVEKQSQGWRLQPPATFHCHSVTPGTSLQLLPTGGYSCHRNSSLLYVTYPPRQWRARLGLLSNHSSQLRRKDGQRVIGKKIYLLIANKQHLSLLACKQGNLALLLH